MIFKKVNKSFIKSILLRVSEVNEFLDSMRVYRDMKVYMNAYLFSQRYNLLSLCSFYHNTWYN